VSCPAGKNLRSSQAIENSRTATGMMVRGGENSGLLFCFMNLHPHLFIQRGDFVNLTGMLGDLIIQILHVGCGCLELAVHTDILAFKRYHGVSPAVYMIS
jgi:hypothetical protein